MGVIDLPEVTLEDWSALIARLERHMHHIEIGTYCARSEAWVGKLKRGEIADAPDTQARILRALDGYYAQRQTVSHET